MNTIITWWADNKVAANLLMIIILIGGIVSFFTIEKEMEPYVEFPGARVNVTWLGASPQDIEEQIVVRLEEAVSQVKGIDRLWSVASEGNGVVVVVGKQDIDGTAFVQDIKQRVDAINGFPSAAQPAVVSRFENRNEIIRVAVSGEVDERLLKRTAEKIRREIALLAYVPTVELFGVRNEEVSIEVSEIALKSYGLTLQQVADAVRATSVNESSGIVRTGVGNMQLRTRTLADTN